MSEENYKKYERIVLASGRLSRADLASYQGVAYDINGSGEGTGKDPHSYRCVCPDLRLKTGVKKTAAEAVAEMKKLIDESIKDRDGLSSGKRGVELSADQFTFSYVARFTKKDGSVASVGGQIQAKDEAEAKRLASEKIIEAWGCKSVEVVITKKSAFGANEAGAVALGYDIKKLSSGKSGAELEAGEKEIKYKGYTISIETHDSGKKWFGLIWDPSGKRKDTANNAPSASDAERIAKSIVDDYLGS